MLRLFGGNRLAHDQASAPIQVGKRPFQLALCQTDGRLCPLTLRSQTEDLARCIGKRSLGRRYSKLRIRFVELHQQIAAPDLIGVVHLHGNHGTDNLGHD